MNDHPFVERQGWAPWKVATALVFALVILGGAAYGIYWSGRLVWAIFLPTNFQYALHFVEVGLITFLGAYLLLGVLYPPGRPRWYLRLEDGRRSEVEGHMEVGSGAENPTAGGLQGSRKAGVLKVLAPTVSRRHLRVERRAEGHLEATDLGSTNGTFYKGRDLRGRGAVVLHHGDRLELGRRGPVLWVDEEHQEGLGWRRIGAIALVALLWVGLYLGWRANLEVLPESAMAIGQVAVDFTPFRMFAPVLALATLATTMLLSLVWASRVRPAMATACLAIGLFLTVGLVVLYALLPASGLRYARAAERALATVGFEDWQRLEEWEQAGGNSSLFAVRDLKSSEAVPLPLGLTEEQTRVYLRGRSALRWAVNLAARDATPFYHVTYFRQATLLLLAFFTALVLPLRWAALQRVIRSVPTRLARPISGRLIRLADRGAPWARVLRPVAYWDVVCGFLAAAVVAITLWTPLGTSLGRGKSLYLDLPGVATIQSVELVKALFVLFMAGYFARHGEVLAKVPRRRYLVPYLLAALITLALTGVKADLGGLFMLGLFLTLVFIAATGSLRLVATVPLLVLPGIFLAWFLGLTTIVETRLGIWWAPRSHALGEQIVQARQLLLSSGWSGFAPRDALAWRLPDVQGDLVIAAVGERFGTLGLLALIAGWFAFGAALLRMARGCSRGASILLASVASLVLVQVLTQVGGTMGLLPLTGVPLPWISHGLTAALVFTILTGLALHAGIALPSRELAAQARETYGRHGGSMAHLRGLNGLACGVLTLLALLWTQGLPRWSEAGPQGSAYRWLDRSRAEEISGWVHAGLFAPQEAGRVARVDRDAYRNHVAGGATDPGLLRLLSTADGLTVIDGEIMPRPYLIHNPNRFADRSLDRGWIFAADGMPLATTDRLGRRGYPLGSSAFHPVGYGGGAARASGVEAAAGGLLRGSNLGWSLRLRSFVKDIHHGPDLTLTLLSELQRSAVEQLAERRGAAVVLDLDDGSILALASTPSPDPRGALVEDWRRWSRQGEKPMRNRAIHTTEIYSPPGSVFKILMAAVALESDKFNAKSRLHCTGYDRDLRVACAHGHAHGEVDLARALRASCNIYFARWAVTLGIEPIRQTAERFGWNADQGRDLLPGLSGAALEAEEMADPNTKALPAGSRVLRAGVSQVLLGAQHLRDRDLARVGYGQGPVSATPLDIAYLGGVIAGRGQAYEPYLVRSVGLSREAQEGSREQVWQRRVAKPRRQDVLPKKVADRLGNILTGVFSQPDGTARRLPSLWFSAEGIGAEKWRLEQKSPGKGWRQVEVAGKTGSAWKTRDDEVDDAWMVAWAPADNPRVVATVLVEDAGEGGKVAGPIVMQLIKEALTHLEVEP